MNTELTSCGELKTIFGSNNLELFFKKIFFHAVLFSRTTFQVADFDHGISNSLFLPVLFKLKMATCTKFPRLPTLPKFLVSSDKRQDMSRDWRCQVKTGKPRVDLGQGPVCSKPLSHDQDAHCPQKKMPLACLG